MNKEATAKLDMQAPKAADWGDWKKRILIAVPATGLVRIEWMMARFGQVIPVNWSHSDMFQYFSQYSPLGHAVADARNVCVEYFMSQGHEWLFFLDHDVCLPPDTFIKLTEYMRKKDTPVMSGLYYCKGSHPEPLLFRGRGNSFYDDWEMGDKVEVDAIPMGCTLIHGSIIKLMYQESEVYTLNTLAGPVVVRRVFETPRHAWFDPEQQRYQSKTGTEDIFWCDRVMSGKYLERAGWPEHQKKKYPFICDTSIFCKHIDEQGRMYP